jgi:mannose-6-phosphate isomerase-like protein (cupin superfamily)
VRRGLEGNPSHHLGQYRRDVRAGDVVWNPLSGEKALIIESAEESGGARIVCELAVEAGGFVPGGEHVHDHCAEHFEVQAGRIGFVVDGEERALTAGQQVTVSPGTWHRWWNAGGEEVRARVRVEPALRFQDAILAVWGLCADGHTDAGGRPSPLYGALVATRYRQEIRFKQPPDVLQRVLFGPPGRGRPATGTRAHAGRLPRSQHPPVRRGRPRSVA